LLWNHSLQISNIIIKIQLSGLITCGCTTPLYAPILMVHLLFAFFSARNLVHIWGRTLMLEWTSLILAHMWEFSHSLMYMCTPFFCRKEDGNQVFEGRGLFLCGNIFFMRWTSTDQGISFYADRPDALFLIYVTSSRCILPIGRTWTWGVAIWVKL
jgi:hypothetical protein